ncbi:MAG: metallophosphoesterase [Clostridia bacterium]|nr:metallophosphoesterase [Clostridia bacterium]
MKILHTADLHLGAALNTKLSPEKIRERRVELFTTFENMAAHADIHGARLFIIAGDLFDTRRLTVRDVERVIHVIASHPETDFLYLPGNHEKNALLESGRELPENLKIFGKNWTYFTYGNLTVAGRSELSADMFGTLSVIPSQKTVVVLHGAVGDKSDGVTVGLRDARELGIDYIALGHYHSYGAYEVDEGCTAVYSGTPEGRGFDECGTKGYVIVDTDGARTLHRFYPIAKRTVQLVSVDISYLSTQGEIQDAVEERLRGIPSADIVRAVITGRRAQDLFPDGERIEARYRDRFYYFEIKDESRTEINPEAYKYDKSLKGEFIRLCISDTELSDEDREKIIRAGVSALLGEDIEI